MGIGVAARAFHNGFGESMALLDANDRFVAQFMRRTRFIGQKSMRSPFPHHLAPDGDLSLADFGRLRLPDEPWSRAQLIQLTRMAERSVPSLSMFLAHVLSVIQQHELHTKAYQFKAERISHEAGGWVIEDEGGNQVSAQYVVLCLGQVEVAGTFGENPLAIPEILHKLHSMPSQRIIISGAGNTATQLITEAMRAGKGHTVWWVVRGEPKFSCTDVPHQYFRSEGQTEFAKLGLPDRLQVLDQTNAGKGLPEHYRLFRQFVRRNLVHIFDGCHIVETTQNNGVTHVRLSNGKELDCDQIIEAHGLKMASLPQFDPSIRTFHGYPVLDDHSLELVDHPGIFVASAHAALSLGPAAKLIDGARLANERIFSTIASRERGITPDSTLTTGPLSPKWGRLTVVARELSE